VKKLEMVETEHKEIDRFLPEIEDKLSGLDREELLRRVVSLQFDKFLDDYRYGEDLISPVADKEERSRDGFKRDPEKRFKGEYKRLFINLGKTDGFFPEQMIDLINKNTTGKKVPIGKIDLLKTFSFFEVEASYAEELIEVLNKARFNDRSVTVEIAQEKPEAAQFEEKRGKRKAKWSDRRPEKRSDRKNKGKKGKKSVIGKYPGHKRKGKQDY